MGTGTLCNDPTLPKNTAEVWGIWYLHKAAELQLTGLKFSPEELIPLEHFLCPFSFGNRIAILSSSFFLFHHRFADVDILHFSSGFNTENAFNTRAHFPPLLASNTMHSALSLERTGDDRYRQCCFRSRHTPHFNSTAY